MPGGLKFFKSEQSFIISIQLLSALSKFLLPLSKGKVCIRAKWPIRPALISGFCSMKRLGILLLPPGWDASPLQGYPQHYDRQYPFIHLGEERQCGITFLVQRNNTTAVTRLEPLTSRSEVQRTTTRPLRLHISHLVEVAIY